MTIEERRLLSGYLSRGNFSQGTYIMNSKGLRAVEHVARLQRIGLAFLLPGCRQVPTARQASG